MRTTVDLDEKLLAEAQARVPTKTKRALLEEALRALIREDAARRLIEAGGTMPDYQPPSRRRSG